MPVEDGVAAACTSAWPTLLNRKRWRTRLEAANAIFEYVEIFHNRKRRHSALGVLTPNEYETLYHQQQAA